MATSNLDILIKVATTGANAIRKVESDLAKLDASSKRSSQSIDKTGLSMAIASEKSARFSDAQRKLAKSVLDGETSFSAAEEKLSKLKDELGLTEEVTEDTSTRFDKFAKIAVGAAAAIGTVTVAAKLAWDTLKQGAELELARDRFDRLTASIGSTADTMLGKLRDATQGMATDAELIASANDIISLGLADTEDGVVRLANLVSQLGWDMQQVIMTFANNSKMRLDALGLSVVDVEEKMKALEAQGYSTDEAFDLAVIEAGEEKLALLGSAAETSAGKIKQLETGWKNFVEAVKLGIAEGAAEELDVTAEASQLAAEGAAELGRELGQNLVPALMASIPGLSDLAFQYQVAAIEAGASARMVEALSQAHENEWRAVTGYGQAVDVATNSHRDYAREVGYGTEATSGFAQVTDRAWVAITGYGEAVDVADTELFQMAQSAGNADQALFNFIGRTQTATGAVLLLADALGVTQSQMAGVSNYLGKSSYSGGGIASAAVQSSKLLGSLKDLKPVAESAGGGVASIVDPAEEAADAMKRLDSATGDFFMKARGMEEWDPFENFAEILDRAGGNATTIADFLLASGKDAGKINEALGRTAVDTASQGIVDALMRGEVSAEEAAAQIGEIQARFEGNTEAARAFLETIETPPEDIEVDADFAAAYEALDAFDSRLARGAVYAVRAEIGEGAGSTAGSGESGRPATRTDADAASGANFIVPPGYHNDSYLVGVTSGEHVQVTPAGRRGSGDTYNIYNYNRQAAAITRAMFQLRRATGIDRRMGVMA